MGFAIRRLSKVAYHLPDPERVDGGYRNRLADGDVDDPDLGKTPLSRIQEVEQDYDEG
jgi:hypothetical protein